MDFAYSIVAFMRIVLPILIIFGCKEDRTSVGPHAWSLPQSTITVKEYELTVEIASKQADCLKGLMYRESLRKNKGMLFVFPRAKFQRFYMKNTYIPLSIAFLEDDGKIINIEKMQPRDSRTKHWSKRQCRLVLEVNQGWFERHGIRPGDRMDIPLEITQEIFLSDG